MNLASTQGLAYDLTVEPAWRQNTRKESSLWFLVPCFLYKRRGLYNKIAVDQKEFVMLQLSQSICNGLTNPVSHIQFYLVVGEVSTCCCREHV